MDRRANMSDARKLPPGSLRYGSYRDQGEETVEDARNLADRILEILGEGLLPVLTVDEFKMIAESLSPSPQPSRQNCGEPVAWRWKPLGSRVWSYADSDSAFPDGAGTLQPVYARQNCGADGVRWQPIETAPHEQRALLGWDQQGTWFCETGMASHGWRRNGISNMSRHGYATHWQSLPAPPTPLTGQPVAADERTKGST